MYCVKEYNQYGEYIGATPFLKVYKPIYLEVNGEESYELSVRKYL